MAAEVDKDKEKQFTAEEEEAEALDQSNKLKYAPCRLFCPNQGLYNYDSIGMVREFIKTILVPLWPKTWMTLQEISTIATIKFARTFTSLCCYLN